jgi:hypothetical protein
LCNDAGQHPMTVAMATPDVASGRHRGYVIIDVPQAP